MISGVHISSSEIVLKTGTGKKSQFPSFTKNQVITAKVVASLPQGKAQLLFDGRLIEAKTAMLLTPGEEVQLKVTRAKESIALKLIGPVREMTSRQISSIVGFFSQTDSIPDITRARLPLANGLLKEMALKSGKADIDFLPRLIEKSGITLENKIARIISERTGSTALKTVMDGLAQQDLKAHIHGELIKAGPGRPGAMNMAASFFESLENFQLLNHHSSESGRYLLPFPVFSDPGFRFGQLMIDTGVSGDSDRNETDKVINISFLLDMTRLGPLRADFSIYKQELSGRFLLADEETRHYIQSLIPELKSKLLDQAYHARKIECCLARPEETQPGSLVESLVKTGDASVFNIVV